MKHGIYYAYWTREWEADYEYYIKKVANLGYDILEIGAGPLVDYTEEQILTLRGCAKDHNIELTVGYGPQFIHNVGTTDLKARASALEWYTKLFAVMQKLDAHKIGGALYSYWPIDFLKGVDKKTDWAASVAGIKELAAIASEYDITLNLEVLNRFENHILNTAEEGVAFVKEVNLPNVKLMLDTFHMNIEEVSIAGAIRTAGPYLAHLHTGECNRLVPGQGRMPWREIGEALRDIGFDGACVQEPFPCEGGQVGADIKIWRTLIPDASEAQLDQDAKESLIFQRYMLEGKSHKF